MRKINHSHLFTETARNTGVKQTVVKAVVEEYTQVMIEKLAGLNDVFLVNFGQFENKDGAIVFTPTPSLHEKVRKLMKENEDE